MINFCNIFLLAWSKAMWGRKGLFWLTVKDGTVHHSQEGMAASAVRKQKTGRDWAVRTPSGLTLLPFQRTWVWVQAPITTSDTSTHPIFQPASIGLCTCMTHIWTCTWIKSKNNSLKELHLSVTATSAECQAYKPRTIKDISHLTTSFFPSLLGLDEMGLRMTGACDIREQSDSFWQVKF